MVDADIQSYFDEIPHDKLLECLRQYVDDTRVLALVQQWLTVEVQDQGERSRLQKGVPQGSPQDSLAGAPERRLVAVLVKRLVAGP